MGKDVQEASLASKPFYHNWRRMLLWGTQCLIAGTLLLFLLRRLNTHLLLDLASHIRWDWAIVSLVAFALVFIVQGLQFKILLSTDQPLSKFYSLAALRYFIGNMIPSSADVSFALLAKSRYQIRIAYSVIGVLLSRFWTGAAAVMWAVVAGIFISNEKWYWWVPALLMLTPVIFGVIIMGLHHISWVKRIPLASSSFLRNYQQKIIIWLEEYQVVQKQVISNRQIQWQIALLNTLAHSIGLITMWAMFEALSVRAGFWKSIGIAVILATVAQLPVNFMGGLGTTSFSLYALLLAFDTLSEPEAAAISLLYQGIFYVLVFSNTLLAWVIWITAPVTDKAQFVLNRDNHAD